MPKIDVNAVAEICKRADIEPAKLRQIVEEMNLAVQPDDDGPERETVKKQFSILISDPNGYLETKGLQPRGMEFTGWVLQIPEDASVTSAPDRIYKAAYEFNTTKKGRMMPARTMGDAIENIPAKHFKEQQVWVKTKCPVFVVTTNNEIPTEASERAEGGGR